MPSANRAALGAAWLCAATAAAAFVYLPWVSFAIPSLDINGIGRLRLEVRNGTETKTIEVGEVQLPRTLSGFGISRAAHDPNADAGLMVFEMMTGRKQHVKAKCLAAYLVPGLALLGAAVLTMARRRAVALAVAVVATGLAAAGAWKLMTAQAAWPSVHVEYGLWVSVGAYVGLAASAAVKGLGAKGEA